jgi:hypothetical protein
MKPVCPVRPRGDCRAIAPTGSPQSCTRTEGEARSKSCRRARRHAQATETDCLPFLYLRNIMGLFMIELPANPRRTALAIAVLADALQIVFFPMFVEGAFSPLDDLLDIAVAWMLIHLLGWQLGVSAVVCR